jgi:hypothetical protein
MPGIVTLDADRPYALIVDELLEVLKGRLDHELHSSAGTAR